MNILPHAVPTVLIKMTKSFGGSEKTHGVGLLLIKGLKLSSLFSIITYNISFLSFLFRNWSPGRI